MTSPAQAITTDDGRYYQWPRFPGRHLPSITTTVKKGVPKPTLSAWEKKKVADMAIERAATVVELKALALTHVK